MSDFSAKMHQIQFQFRLGLRPRPRWELAALARARARPLADDGGLVAPAQEPHPALGPSALDTRSFGPRHSYFLRQNYFFPKYI